MTETENPNCPRLAKDCDCNSDYCKMRKPDLQCRQSLESDDLLRGQPKVIPCFFCGASRKDQIRLSFYTEKNQPLCKNCYELKYGKTEP